ncbi:MAG: protein kinase, partial [Pirellulales bacterium]
MSIPDASVFCTAALSSGLLDESLLQASLAELRQAGADSPAPLVEVGDDLLAAHLIERGKLNPWQAEQLKAGRSKFNLGPYHIIDSIGQGGMGQVFKAEHSLMGRVVAIKVLPKNKSTPETIAGFSQEIRAQAQLDHDNLVRAYDAGHDG